MIFKNKGFTLIEVLVSLLFIVIITAAFSTFLIGSLQSEDKMNEQHQTRRINNSIIENLKRNKYKEKLGLNNISWEEDASDFNHNQIRFVNEADKNTDITIEVKETAIDDLFYIKIDWENKNYNSEIFITGE